MAVEKIRGKSPMSLVAAVIAAGIILTAGTYLLLFSGNGDSAGNSDYTLKASISYDCTGTPWFVGVGEGFFRNAGLNFVDLGQTVTEQRGTALALGQIDVLDADPLTLVNMIKSGIQVKAVAQSGDSPLDGDPDKEYMQWLVMNDSSLQSFASIKDRGGKVRIAIAALGTSPELQTEELLKMYGVPKEDIEFVIIPDQNQQQALRQGLIDVAVLHAAYYACAHANGGVRILATSTDAFGNAGGTTLLLFTENFIRDHPDTIRKFITAYKETERWCNANRDEAGRITADRLGICTGVAHYYSGSGAINETQLQYWLDVMVENGILSQGELTPRDLYTGEFSDVW
jgi:ABC-type nitrate/sulfonate/bicarbonate transport system substrate-binding protein